MTTEQEHDIIIHPRKGKNEKKLPQNGLLLVNPTEAKGAINMVKQDGGYSRYLFNSSLALDSEKRFFVAGPAIGAPMAVMTMEKLIALGSRRLILVGWCGAVSNSLHIGDILVPSSSLSGEGTSQYYPLNSPAVPHSGFLLKVNDLFEKKGLAVQSGCVWSTDAIFRENRSDLSQLNQENGVAAIDMEFSALCSVACFRQIEFCAVLIVSDELYRDSWHPGFSNKRFLKNKQVAMDILLGNISFL